MRFVGRLQVAEESVGFGNRSRGEEERIRTSSATAVTERQSPEPFDLNRSAIQSFEQAVEFAVEPKRHDGPAAEVAHEQVTGMLSKCARRQGYSPRRVDLGQVAAG